ncbi:R-spondin-3-like [Oncorhynchus kisutch]|uniref:R-spondin-3-like n=1 Tax=Oncorhynchus kisutch TaxID=8019 RepID=UPI0012DCBF75|nr:R-spondin-3-like [Oncorhynchus kisutch]
MHMLKTCSLVVSRLCHAGCLTCSALNGCLSCKPRLFFHLKHDGMRERGTCLLSCPRGHYGTRSPHVNTCTKCREDCVSCFNRNFCTHCHQGHYLYRGRCENSCPEGLTPNAALRECNDCLVGCEVCVTRNTCTRCRAGLYLLHGQCHHTCPGGFEPDRQLMECISQVHCQVGEWGDWGLCFRRGRDYRNFVEVRRREVLRHPTLYGDPCPKVKEWRKCVIERRPSPALA